MTTDQLPGFNLNHHCYVASRFEYGRVMPDLVASSQAMLLAEVERLPPLHRG